MRIVYLNGDFLPESEAKVSVFDRGFLMADAVYEGIAILDGKICDFKGHMARLKRSFSELNFNISIDEVDVLAIIRELVQKNDLIEGFVYLQITRGKADRNFVIPDDLVPTIMAFTQIANIIDNPNLEKGLKVVTREDLRWGRCDIKTTQLLWASLMKTEAAKEGADDVWLVRDGMIMEGASNNAFIVKDDVIITRPTDRRILPGITRQTLIELCNENHYEIDERFFTVQEAQEADEAFMTAAMNWAVPILSIDGHKIGDGKRGKVTRLMNELYVKNARANLV